MTETARFDFHTVNHTERFNKRMNEKAERLTGATIVVDGSIENMPSLYPKATSVYAQLLANLRSAKYLPDEASMLDDFMVVGFPRVFLSFDKLQTVDLIVSVPDGVFVLEMFFNYRGGNSVEYRTAIHTGLATSVRPSTVASIG